MKQNLKEEQPDEYDKIFLGVGDKGDDCGGLDDFSNSEFGFPSANNKNDNNEQFQFGFNVDLFESERPMESLRDPADEGGQNNKAYMAKMKDKLKSTLKELIEEKKKEKKAQFKIIQKYNDFIASRPVGLDQQS